MSNKEKKEAKFGIADFAKHIGVAPASARDKLRRANLAPKEGKYGWDSVKAMADTAAKLKPAKKAVKAADAKKAVKKAPVNKAVNKVKDKAAA
jgi:hypothetical protein